MILLTELDRPCTQCHASGHRPEETTDCPHCQGHKSEPIATVVDGRLFMLFPGKPLEIESKGDARTVSEMLERYGVVQVKETKRPGGVDYDLAGASKHSHERIKIHAQKDLEAYVAEQQQRKQKNMAVLPPTGQQAWAVDFLKVDLSQHGLDPVGYKVGERKAEQDAYRASLEATVKAQDEKIAKLLAMVEGLAERAQSDADDDANNEVGDRKKGNGKGK
jgi:hypothetical protein